MSQNLPQQAAADASAKAAKVAEMHDGLARIEKQLTLALGPVADTLEELYHTITLPDGHTTTIKVVKPKQLPADGSPLIVLFHGGGFQAGTIEQLTRPARDFAAGFNAVVVTATYRFAPAHKFPVGVEDAWSTLEWLAANSTKQFGARPERGFIVGGYSAGGSIAGSLSVESIQRKLQPPITGTILCIPHLLMEEIVPEKYQDLFTSRVEHKDNPMLGGNIIRDDIVGVLQPDLKSPLFSPVNNSRLSEAAPTYIQVGGLDPLRDDGVVYERVLRDLGVPTRIDVYPELAHDAWTVYANESSPKALGENTMKGMGWLLGDKSEK